LQKITEAAPVAFLECAKGGAQGTGGLTPVGS